MSTTTKRIVWVLVAALLALFLWQALGPSRASARPLARAVTTTTHHHGLTITRTVGRGICTEHPNGVLAGWSLKHRAEASSVPHTWHYTFGPWSGSYCSNKQMLWSVQWGGSPDGSANGIIGWNWFPSDTVLADSDNAGDVRFRKWRSHFNVRIAGVGRDEFPWLYVLISTNANITLNHACGC